MQINLITYCVIGIASSVQELFIATHNRKHNSSNTIYLNIAPSSVTEFFTVPYYKNHIISMQVNLTLTTNHVSTE